MPLTDVTRDIDNRTLVMTAEFPVTPERLWQVWADPRQLERWWGPPGYPATFTAHDLSSGGVVSYYMTSPEGERYHGGWRVLRRSEDAAIADNYATERGVFKLSLYYLFAHFLALLIQSWVGGW